MFGNYGGGMNSYSNYNSGFNSYGGGGMMGGYGMNNMNSMNNMNNMNNGTNQPQISSSMQIVYGLLSGSQSLLSIAGSFIDVAYFFKSIKYLLYDFIVSCIKKLFRLIKYLVTFRWLISLVKKSGELSYFYILKNSYVSALFLSYKIAFVLGKCFYIILFIYYNTINIVYNLITFTLNMYNISFSNQSLFKIH